MLKFFLSSPNMSYTSMLPASVTKTASSLVDQPHFTMRPLFHSHLEKAEIMEWNQIRYRVVRAVVEYRAGRPICRKVLLCFSM